MTDKELAKRNAELKKAINAKRKQRQAAINAYRQECFQTFCQRTQTPPDKKTMQIFWAGVAVGIAEASYPLTVDFEFDRAIVAFQEYLQIMENE